MPGNELVRIRLECSTICTNKVRIYSIKQGLSRFEHDFQNDFHIRLLYGYSTVIVRSSTVCIDLVRLNTIFTRLTGHLQGLHTAPPTFVRFMLELSHIRVCFDINLTRFDAWLHKFSNFQQKKV